MTWACLRQQQQQSKNLEKGLEPVTYESSIVSTMRHLCFVFLSANSQSDIEIVNSAIFTKGWFLAHSPFFYTLCCFSAFPNFFPHFNLNALTSYAWNSQKKQHSIFEEISIFRFAFLSAVWYEFEQNSLKNMSTIGSIGFSQKSNSYTAER